MKKFVSFLFAMSVVILATFTASAADISVKVDGRTVAFREEPKPIVLNDRTYVPVRRVLEQMGAKVSWDGEKRTVTVTSPDNIKVVVLTIDSPEISVYTFTSVLHADLETVLSDVSPIILNDRTMLPIRVIAESLGAKVSWDENGVADITTLQAQRVMKKAIGENNENPDITQALSENLPKISLFCDAKDIKEGDEVDVYVRISDLDKADEDAAFSGFVTTVLYDTENFEYEGFACISKNGEVPPALSADNGTFYENGAKIVYIFTPNSLPEAAEDGTVLKLKFTALSNNGGTFSLSDGISEVGYDNEVVLVSGNNSYSISKYDELFIDTSAITVK
ncbi:MAG: hypothetical protein K5768_00980 [Firmicutes bacterium]|nr:hypothetical protein [Bacillota bacterium]